MIDPIENARDEERRRAAQCVAEFEVAEAGSEDPDDSVLSMLVRIQNNILDPEYVPQEEVD